MKGEPYGCALDGVWDLAEALYNEADWKLKSAPVDADTFIAWRSSAAPRMQGRRRMNLAVAGHGAGALEGFKIYRPPVPSRVNRAPRIDDEAGGSLELEWHPDVLEKPKGSKRDTSDTEQSPNQRWLGAVWAVSGRIHAVERGMDSDANDAWEYVEEAFLDPYGRGFEPTMDVLVEHARTLNPVLADLAQNPRKVLRRTHRNVPVGAVAEMDGRTLRWLSKQPGRDTAERAGIRQTVLAPVREEDLDTLENRALRAVADLSTRLVGEHLGGGGRRALLDPRKQELLAAYRRRCRTLDRSLRLQRVRVAQPGVSPNYVLQHDGRYRAVWDAWQALLAHGRARDLVWSWQSRSWDEFCLLFAIVACRWLTHMVPITEMPLQVRREQREGRWIALHDPAAVFFPKVTGNEWTVEVRTPVEHGSGAPPGTAACLELRTWDGRTKGRMLVYALHSFRGGKESDDLEGLERVCKLMERREKGLGRVFGVALRSVMDGSGGALAERDGRVMRAAFAPDSDLTVPMDKLVAHIEEWIRDAVQ